MTRALDTAAPAPTRPSGAWRLLPTPRVAAAVVTLLTAFALLSGTGFGVSTAAESVTANVVSTLTLTDPTALNAAPQVCTDGYAPLDTDDCTDVTFTPGSPGVLDLGALSGSDVQAGALTWKVTTTNPTGYQVVIANTGAAPVLQASGVGTIADMQTSPLLPASAVDDATQFGIAVGNSVADNEAAVGFGGSPWVTGGADQGELYRSVPTGGVVIAQRATPQTNDPITVTFAAASIATAQPAPGSYTGTVRLTATAL